jgi:acetolactate synthase-1/2/3 large subunit
MGDLEFYCQPPDWGDFAAQKFIQVDIDPSILGRGRDVDIAILGDAKEVLADLLTELKAVTKKREMGKEVERLKEINRKWREEMIAAAEKAPSSPVHPGKLALEVRDFFPRDALMAMDVSRVPSSGHPSSGTWAPVYRISWEQSWRGLISWPMSSRVTAQPALI